MAIYGDGGSGLAFHMNKDYYYRLWKAEVRRSHGMADLRILGTGCSPHSQHQPTLGSVCVGLGAVREKVRMNFQGINHIQSISEKTSWLCEDLGMPVLVIYPYSFMIYSPFAMWSVHPGS